MTDFCTTYEKPPQTPISAGFVPDPNGFYTAHSVANFLGCSERAARSYFRTLQIPVINEMGYIGSDIIAATVDLRAGRLRREPLPRSRPPVPKSDTPKYAAANGDAPPQTDAPPRLKLTMPKQNHTCKRLELKKPCAKRIILPSNLLSKSAISAKESDDDYDGSQN